MLLWPVAGRAQSPHQGDLWVGRSGTRLALSPLGTAPGRVYYPLDELPPWPEPSLFYGWSSADPGFDAVRSVDSVNGVSPLQSGASIYVELVNGAGAFRLWDSDLMPVQFPGDRALLGGTTLHTHLTWHIDLFDDSFHEEQCVWAVTYRLADTGSTRYMASAPFTMLFTNVPVRQATGDFDGDADRDLDDAAALAVCLHGPGVRPAPDDPSITTCEVECHNGFDFDADLDVDLRDVLDFQRRVTD